MTTAAALACANNGLSIISFAGPCGTGCTWRRRTHRVTAMAVAEFEAAKEYAARQELVDAAWFSAADVKAGSPLRIRVSTPPGEQAPRRRHCFSGHVGLRRPARQRLQY